MGIVSLEYRYPATPEKIFDAFLDVDIASKFMFATATGHMRVAKIDPRVGGHYVFSEQRPEMGEVRHIGTYLQIDRPGRLAFTFGVPQLDPRMTTVIINIEKDHDESVLTLVQEGVLPEYIEGSKKGWACILAGVLPAYEGFYAAGWKL